MNDTRAFLTVDEVATLLGYSTKTIRRRIADGSIRKAPLGGRSIRIPVSELDRLSGITPTSVPAEISEQGQQLGGAL